MRKRSALVIAMVVGAFAMLGVKSAAADTIEVTNTDNSGAGSLRAAINQANQLAPIGSRSRRPGRSRCSPGFPP